MRDTILGDAGIARHRLESLVSNNGREAVRRERLVKNELAFRDYNNRRLEIEQQAAEDNPEDEVAPFVCECGSADCIGALMVTVDQYETAHSAPDRFIVKPEHVYHDVEHVIEQHDHYWTVEKHPGEMPLH
jgi:5-bromo-4-chloroindolyl phosphate hydrolysis protein